MLMAVAVVVIVFVALMPIVALGMHDLKSGVTDNSYLFPKGEGERDEK